MDNRILSNEAVPRAAVAENRNASDRPATRGGAEVVQHSPLHARHARIRLPLRLRAPRGLREFLPRPGVHELVAVAKVKLVVVATGLADTAATVDEKAKVLNAAGVPYLVVRGHGDLDGLVHKVVERAKAAAKAPAVPEPDDGRPKPYVTKGGAYVDPRAVRDRTKPYVPPFVATVKQESLPPLPAPAPIPGLGLADHELRRLQELMEAEDERRLQQRLQEARAQVQAELAQLRAAETHEQKKERATELLRADHEKWRAEHGAAAVAERRRRAAQRDQADAVAVAAYRADEGERELTGEESAEQDELPDDTEANRSE